MIVTNIVGIMRFLKTNRYVCVTKKVKFNCPSNPGTFRCTRAGREVRVEIQTT